MKVGIGSALTARASLRSSKDASAFAPELALESEGFEAGYFARLAEQEAGNFWFRSRNRLLIWALERYFPNAKNFLEIGCGTGFVLSGLRKAFPNLVLSGSEVFTEGLGFAAARLPGVDCFRWTLDEFLFAKSLI